MAKKESKKSIESRTSPKEVWVVRKKVTSTWSSFYGLFRKSELFTDYDKLIRSINTNDIIKIDNYKLESTSEEGKGSDMVKTFLQNKEREQNLSILMGDDDVESGYDDVIRFRNFVNENSPPTDNNYYNYIFSSINKYCVSRSSLKNYIVKHSDNFLSFNKSVEYYELLLKLHNFRNYGYYKNVESEGLTNFLQAKKNLKKK